VKFALELDSLLKRFGAVEALAGASLRVREGTVHALLGENGAGKTTLMRIAYGMLRPDGGTIRIFGQDARPKSSADAIALGVGMVHQHFALVPAMSVAENVSLGMHGRYDAATAAERVRTLGERTGLVLEPGARVDTLPVGAQQRLEILKALARDARLLILDEPTAVLAPEEAEELLQWVRRYRDAGHTVVLITHKLREALAVADDVTVVRHGRTVLTGTAESLDEPSLIEALVGTDTEPGQTSTSPHLHAWDETAIPAVHTVVAALRDASVAQLHGAARLRDVTLEVRAGEIVGIAAVEGSGQYELLRLLAGRLAPTSGSASIPDSIAFIPEDRHRDAMVLSMSLTENAALRGLSSRRGAMPWRELRADTERLLQEFDVRGPSVDASARELSGGNQQKFVLGRELADEPPMVVAENPTRGLDIRATAAVREQLRRARDRGAAVVVYSSDLDEVIAMADRMLVVHAGRVRAIDPPTRELVGRAMVGAE